MSSTVIPSSNFKVIFDAALASYREHTGVDLSQYPFAEKLQSCQSADAILELLQEKVKEFKDFRNGNHKLINCLRPVVQVLHTFSGVLNDVPFQPTNLIFYGVDLLLCTAIGVETSYDGLVELFKCVANFFGRLRIYSEIPFEPTMSGLIIRIMVEMLSVLALATKQIKQGRIKKFAKKLLGESEIEAVLQRLDRLTLDEARMTAAQTLQVIHGLVNNMKVVMDDGKASTSDIRRALITMQEMTIDVNRIKRDQLQRDIRDWLSPPDPSTNHNVACNTHRSGSSTWFTDGSTFEGWKSKGSLLWIHGKPGSGKSVLCSSIIQEIKVECDSGLALMGYYYFDFRDTEKQDIRGLLTSLLAQLCAKSDSCYDILSKLYSKNNAGSEQPNNRSLTECLKEMLQLPLQPMIFIIVDAVDECPNSSGFPNVAREELLDLLKELLELNLPDLRICVTSRPEADIREVLEPLESRHMSLHDEDGQKNGILHYISSVVRTDRKMQKWKSEDKQLVIDILSAKADGMFRWVVCQLDMLRRCFAPSLRDAVNELPETLDETYERILSGIDKEKREYAHRLLQCLAVAIRPLRVQDLADILAMRFACGRLPHYDAGWKQEDPREAVLSACSSLVAVVNIDGSPIVQFSHFSVKEFLTSNRLSKAESNLSRYHIDSLSAHTILAQASLSILFHLDPLIDKKTIEDFPFAIYAAQHWVDHGRFEGVSSKIQGAMERLFDADNPSFATWIWIYDLDYPLKEHMFTPHPKRPEAVPLYYATLCGFRDVVKHLLATHQTDIDTRGGYHTTPLHAALAKGNFQIANLLLEHHADVHAPDHSGLGALHIASRTGRRDNMEFLLERHGDAHTAKDRNGSTPLVIASSLGELEVAEVLLQHGAAVDFPDDKGWTPLFAASRYGHLEVVQLLIQSHAAVDRPEDDHQTPLFVASGYGHLEIVRLLIDSGATVDSPENDGCTPLFAATRNGHRDIVQLLIKSGAAVNARQTDKWTPLFVASRHGHPDISLLLIQSGGAVDLRSNDDWTPLMLASANGHLGVTWELLDRDADPNAQNTFLWTPLHIASAYGHLEIVRLLIKNGSKPNVHDIAGWTPLHNAAHHGYSDIVELLLESRADLVAKTLEGKTPSDVASANGKSKLAKFLMKRLGVNPYDDRNVARLDTSFQNPPPVIVLPSLGYEEHVGSQDNKRISLHVACMEGNSDVIQSLLSHNVDINERDDNQETPLGVASRKGKLEVVKVLVNNGADVHSKNEYGWNPLHFASRDGHLEIVQLLIEHDANVNAKEQDDWTALHLASTNGQIEIVRLLLKRGANAEMRNNQDRTPSDEASRRGELKIKRILSQASACRV